MSVLQDPLAQRLAWTLVHFLWQGAALGILAWAVLSMLRRHRPQVRYVVACLFLLTCLLAPVTTFARLSPVSRVHRVPFAENEASKKTLSFRTINAIRQQVQPALPGVLAAWALTVCLLSIRTFGSWLWIRRVKASAHLIREGEWALRLERLMRRAGIHRVVQLLETDRVKSPFTIGVLKPVILVPVGFFTGIDAVAAEAILAHELAHIRRLDVLMIALQSILETLLFYHPAVWWISQRVRTEREHCCDDAAVQACGDPIRFAEILNLLSAFDPDPVVHAPAAMGGQVLERIRRLLGIDPGRPRFAVPSLSIAVTAALCTTLAAHQEPVQRRIREIPMKLVELGDSILHRTKEEVKGAEAAAQEMAPRPEAKAEAPQSTRSEILASPIPYSIPKIPLMSVSSAILHPEIPKMALSESEATPVARMETTTLFQNLRQPKLDTEAKEFKDWTFTQGHSTYTLSGKASFLRAEGRAVGFFFTGKGQFRYISNFAFEHPTLKYNASLNCYSKIEPCPDGLAITQRVESGLFWFAGSPLPELPGTSTASDEKAFRSAWKLFEEKDQNALAQSIALRWIGSTARPYFKAQLECGTVPIPFVHVIDGLDSERLMVSKFRALESPYSAPWVQLSRQMQGWDYHLPRNPRFILTHVNLDLKAPGKGLSTLMVQETILPFEEGLKAIDLDLYSFRVEKDSVDGWVKRAMRVVAVRDAKGNSLAFDHRDHRIVVVVPDLKPQTPVTLTFELEGSIAPQRRLLQSCWLLDNGPWFPLPSEWSARAFTVNARLQVDDPYLPIMSGETVRRVHEGKSTLLETKLDKPAQSFGAMAGCWDIREEIRNGITIRIAGINLDGVTCRSYIENIDTYLRQFSRLLGPFPFKEVNYITWSRPVASPTILGGSIIKQPQDPGPVPNFPAMFSLNVAELVARQYFGQVVQLWSPEDLWVTEGFSEYLARMAMLGIPAIGPKWFSVQEDYWANSASRASDSSPIALAHTLVCKDGDQVQAYFPTALICHKGAAIIGAIHDQLGDQAFMAFLNRFMESLSWHRAMASQIPFCVQEATGMDIAPLMEKHYWGAYVPPKHPASASIAKRADKR